MTHSNDSRRPRRTRRQFTAAALILLASVAWVQRASAAYPHSGGSAASGKIGAFVQTLAIDPDTPTTLYAGTQCSGVLKSLDGGDSWSAVNTGLANSLPNIVWITALAINPDTPTTLYAGTYEAGTGRGAFKSLNGGSSWQATGLTSTAVAALAIHPTTPTTLYAGTFGGVFRSLNEGSSWSEVNTGLRSTAVTVLAINPDTPTTLYAGGSGVLRSLDGGDSWSEVNTGLTNMVIRALAIDPATPATLYAGTDAGVFQSVNGGSSWREINTGLPSTYIFALAIDPATPATVYAGTLGEGVFRSPNGGSSWSAVNTGLTTMGIVALAIDPVMPTTLYAGTSWGGVFRSVNGGSSWQATGLGGPVCGDGLAACGEQCDDGNLVDGDGCDSNCTPTACGNGVVTTGEECDDGNTNPGDGCDATCRFEFCGDAIVQPGLAEQCDDGNRVDGDGCDSNCTPTACGNGIVTAGEQCDDGNRNPFDGCTNDCTVCGDGIRTAPEECDDGNASGGDGCDSQCRRPRVVGTGTPQSCTETAFAAALAQRSVRFNCGPAPVTILTGGKVITATTTIDGGGLITLSGGGLVRIFLVDGSAALDVRNLTIADGRAEYDGYMGGGGIVNSGTLTLTNCTLSGNSAFGYAGGGIINYGTATVTNCTLSGNSAGNGGGIYNAGTLTLTNCTLSANSGAGQGGGIANRGTATLANCTLSGNSASAEGGGIYNFGGGGWPPSTGGLLTLTNCTLSGNSADHGGGIFGATTLRNTIVANSAAGGDCTGVEINDAGHNVIEDATNSCGLTNGVNGNLVGVDPLLGPLADNGGPTQTIALLPGSLAIDAGDPEVCANPPVNGLDQRGYVRPGVGHTQCSIGAYEADAATPCVGDCNGKSSVTVADIITMVSIALGTTSMAECGSGDTNYDNQVTVDEILVAVSNALTGCPRPLPTPRFVTQNATLYDYWPCFSPDSRSLLFSRTADGVHWELRLVPVAGGPSVSFASTPLSVSATRANWSPNGDRVAFSGVSTSSASMLWLISPTGTDAHRVTVRGLSGLVFYPSFYPDGNRLAITDLGAGGLNGGVLRLVDLAQATVASLTNHSEFLTGQPAVSPDGQRVAFAGQRNVGQTYDETQNSIFILEPSGTVTQPNAGLGRTPAWSPDGEWIAFESSRASPAGRYAAFVMRPDGSGLRQLTDVSLDANHPVFSPDGRLLAFSASQPGWPQTARGIAVIDVSDL